MENIINNYAKASILDLAYNKTKYTNPLMQEDTNI